MSPKIIDEATLEAREEEIMRTALEIISELGVAGLTIDKVVSQLPYSKGTVYNHFTCKEDLLTGLCNRSVKSVAALFERAITFDGSSRAKMLAVGYAYMLHSMLNPTEFMLVISAKTPSVREKSTERRQEEHVALENRLLGGLLQVISNGLASGELQLLPHLSPAQVAFSLWSMSFGTIALLHETLDRCSVRIEMQLERELVNHCNILLDGLNWQPYTQDHNWMDTIDHFKNELFASEVEQLRERLNG